MAAANNTELTASIDSYATVNNFVQTMVGSEDNMMNTYSLAVVITLHDVITLSCAETVNFAAVNMRKSSKNIITEICFELIVKLHREKNTRSNNNNGLKFVKRLQSTLAIFHHDDSLAATCRNIHTTFVCVLDSIESARLVGSELHVVL